MVAEMTRVKLNCRYFVSYTGIQLPLKLVNELDAESLQNRITYFRAFYDENDYLKILEKVVYGEIELIHHYEYHPDGTLSKAILIEEGDGLPRTLNFENQEKVTQVR